jgi:hypothetical protein
MLTASLFKHFGDALYFERALLPSLPGWGQDTSIGVVGIHFSNPVFGLRKITYFPIDYQQNRGNKRTSYTKSEHAGFQTAVHHSLVNT